MGWFRRDPPAPKMSTPPVISEHANEVITEARETRKFLEKLFTENHFSSNMKKKLKRPGKKKA